MIGLEDRQSLSQDIGVAHAAGARLHLVSVITQFNGPLIEFDDGLRSHR